LYFLFPLRFLVLSIQTFAMNKLKMILYRPMMNMEESKDQESEGAPKQNLKINSLF